MDAEFEVKLIECLGALEAGQPLEQVLARYPEAADELRPILNTAVGLSAFRMMPSEAQRMKSRRAFLAQAQALQPQAKRGFAAFGPWARLAVTFGAVVLVIAVLGGGMIAASNSALPGDPLYGLKRAVEDTRLALTGNNATLSAQFEEARRIEINALLDAGREAPVAFRGPIEFIQSDRLIIGGLVVRRTDDTQIIGSLRLDRVAEVRAMTGPDGLVASSIVVAGPDDATPTPAPQPSATPQPTITATPRPGPVEPTEPRPTRLPAPTVTPAPPPTARPVEIEFTGVIDAMGDPQWSIDGTAVTVNAQTELRGNLGVGRRVNVKALRMGNGQLVALSIEVIDDNPGGNTNDNQNGNDGNHNDNENHNDNKNDNHNENDNHNNNDNRNKNDNHNENDD